MKNKEAEIHVTDRCNHNCVFCSVRKHPEKDPSNNEIKENIMLSSNFSRLVLSGGEPLLRDDLKELINFAKKYNEYVSLETNLSLYDKRFLEKVLSQTSLDEIKVSFHSNKEQDYEKITNSLDFRNVLRNIKKLRKYSDKLRIVTNTVVTKHNYRDLPDIVSFIENNLPFVSEIRISYPRFYPVKGHQNYSKEFLVPLEKLRPILEDIKQKNVLFENFPLCIVHDSRAEKIEWNTELIKDGKVIKNLEGRYYPKGCKNCNKRKKCQGLHKYYNLYFNDNFVKPFLD